jgi:hypothetical protein
MTLAEKMRARAFATYTHSPDDIWQIDWLPVITALSGANRFESILHAPADKLAAVCHLAVAEGFNAHIINDTTVKVTW